ncbi:hypothetical protein F2Q68_00021826 [Brassica cretica]|uniref:Uncharacterized protein n=1 Tax=Brassica cretica TaxID=69181 RepID=A0A8S9G2Q2_BRACR|nr:hypothetical protein F2Q68_00021826 [Brassica cretica]
MKVVLDIASLAGHFNFTGCSAVLNGKVMRQVGVEVIGFGAFKLTGFLKEKMQENNTTFQSLYTVRTLKEALPLINFFLIAKITT